jgi:hypothetical protein
MEEKWKNVKNAINRMAETILGPAKGKTRSPCFDEECKIALERREGARTEYIRKKTRASQEEYKCKRRDANRICRKKKRVYEKERLEELKNWEQKSKVTLFYEMIQKQKKGFQQRVDFCQDRRGNLIGGKEDIKKRWTEYFEELLNVVGKEKHNQEVQYISPHTEIELEKPTLQEVKEVIQKLRNN